ncbi:MAG: hypothetical protein AMK69_16960 [Nitrospira bacterium SG8_3]|nr:MAG: hypothetical protein AMK69_16960 [Nitrospira bacterium SG8_3]
MKDSILGFPNLLLVIYLLLLWGGVRSIYAEQVTGQKTINFQWAFGAIKTSEGPGPQPVTRDTTLKTGDQIKFFLKIREKCFVYLLYRSSQGELSVLFPFRFKQLKDEYDISGNHYIPHGDQWFELDEQVGQEKFYLLASATQLYQLETLINAYESADAAKKLVLAERIITDIHTLRKRHLKFKTYAERPVSIIGNMRGTEKASAVKTYDVAEFAVEISADTFYSRTFTIEHQ